MTGMFIPTVVGCWFWKGGLTGEVGVGVGAIGSGCGWGAAPCKTVFPSDGEGLGVSVGASVTGLETRVKIAGIVGGVGGRIEPVEGTRTEDRVGCIFFNCDCIDIGVPGGMDGIGV